MLILKKINNNVALASNDPGEEIVVFGKGVGFPKTPYELEDESIIQRVFADVDEQYMGSSRICLRRCASGVFAYLTTAGKALDCKLSGNLAFTLADHIQYAIERVADGIVSLESPQKPSAFCVSPRSFPWCAWY